MTGAGDNILIAPCCQNSGSELFFGLINTATPFQTFTLINTGIGDGWGLDKFQFSFVPVAEPTCCSRWLECSAARLDGEVVRISDDLFLGPLAAALWGAFFASRGGKTPA